MNEKFSSGTINKQKNHHDNKLYLIEQGNDNGLLTVNIQYATTEAHLTSFD